MQAAPLPSTDSLRHRAQYPLPLGNTPLSMPRWGAPDKWTGPLTNLLENYLNSCGSMMVLNSREWIQVLTELRKRSYNLQPHPSGPELGPNSWYRSHHRSSSVLMGEWTRQVCILDHKKTECVEKCWSPHPQPRYGSWYKSGPPLLT